MAKVDSAIPYIKKSEGGLSRAVTDTASKNPAPWPYNGKTGWHTNKGITYTTFVGLAPKLGYAITADNFFVMPDGIWFKIYKHGYWDPMQGDKINSQAMANAMADYAWAFGVGGAEKRIKRWLLTTYNIKANTMNEVAAAINTLTAKDDEDVFLKFIIHRKAAFTALNQPANEKGWLARMEDLKNEGLKLVSKVTKTVSENKGAVGATLFFLALTAVGYVYRNEIKKVVLTKLKF
ncbi:MAG: glycosyl hydrolase 108 family protein [Bacteroidota bacterium]